MEKEDLTCGPMLTKCGDMPLGSNVAVKTSQNEGKTAVVAICTWSADFDG